MCSSELFGVQGAHSETLMYHKQKAVIISFKGAILMRVLCLWAYACGTTLSNNLKIVPHVRTKELSISTSRLDYFLKFTLKKNSFEVRMVIFLSLWFCVKSDKGITLGMPICKNHPSWDKQKVKLKHRAYHSWQLVFRNPADFTPEIQRISPVKSAGFHLKSAGFHECELLGDDQV